MRTIHYSCRDGIVGYGEGDILIERESGRASRAIRDGSGIVLERASEHDEAGEPTDHAIIHAMIRRGGSFARALGEAAQCADAANLQTIKTAFAPMWAEYTGLAAWLAKEGKGPK